MKKFNVIIVEDNSNIFDLFNQLKIAGTRDTLDDAKKLAAQLRENIENEMLENAAEEDIEYEDPSEIFETTINNDGLWINISNNDAGIYYNIIIKEFEI